MTIQLYIVDSFTDTLFSGNPAAVCVLDEWLPDEVLQKIAAENNLSETAFFVAREESPYLRWFTPKAEIDLCGHATLAAGFVALTFVRPGPSSITFGSVSGPLTVSKETTRLTLDFPRRDAQLVAPPQALLDGLGVTVAEVRKARDYIVVLSSEQEVRDIRPNFALLRDLDALGIAVTARGETFDFVSRAFFPKIGINEDPVTGATHCSLAPYWAEKLGRSELSAAQLSPRGGELVCSVTKDRVFISGEARLFARGEIHL
jgi:PhzF family phenazine biosynthesis protein